MRHLKKGTLSAAVGRLSDAETNIDVQGLAVRCLSALIPRITESRIKEVAESLTEGFAAGRPDLRDVYAIGLKTLVMKAPEGFARCVCDALVARMLILIETGGGGTSRSGAWCWGYN